MCLSGKSEEVNPEDKKWVSYHLDKHTVTEERLEPKKKKNLRAEETKRTSWDVDLRHAAAQKSVCMCVWCPGLIYNDSGVFVKD